MSARAWAAFAGLSVLWGIPYLFIKMAVDDGIPPLFLAWVRVTLGACLLLGLAWRTGTLRSVRGEGRWIVAYALMEICLPFPLIAFGEQRVSSSLTAILIASVPTFVVLLALRFNPTERLTRIRLVGLVIGFAGVVALVGIDVAGSSRELLGTAAVLLASFGYACGPTLYQRRFTGADVPATMGWTLVAASVVLLPLALLDTPDHLTGRAVASLAVLGVFCTAGAFALFAVLLQWIGAARTSIVTYLAPVVALTGGVAFLDETVGPGAIVGLVLILAGSWLSTDGRLPASFAARRRPRRAPSPP